MTHLQLVEIQFGDLMQHGFSAILIPASPMSFSNYTSGTLIRTHLYITCAQNSYLQTTSPVAPCIFCGPPIPMYELTSPAHPVWCICKQQFISSQPCKSIIMEILIALFSESARYVVKYIKICKLS